MEAKGRKRTTTPAATKTTSAPIMAIELLRRKRAMDSSARSQKPRLILASFSKSSEFVGATRHALRVIARTEFGVIKNLRPLSALERT
jgi:hypothetical protein